MKMSLFTPMLHLGKYLGQVGVTIAGHVQLGLSGAVIIGMPIPFTDPAGDLPPIPEYP